MARDGRGGIAIFDVVEEIESGRVELGRGRRGDGAPPVPAERCATAQRQQCPRGEAPSKRARGCREDVGCQVGEGTGPWSRVESRAQGHLDGVQGLRFIEQAWLGRVPCHRTHSVSVLEPEVLRRPAIALGGAGHLRAELQGAVALGADEAEERDSAFGVAGRGIAESPVLNQAADKLLEFGDHCVLL